MGIFASGHFRYNVSMDGLSDKGQYSLDQIHLFRGLVLSFGIVVHPPDSAIPAASALQFSRSPSRGLLWMCS